MKKDFIVSKIEASQDGTQYVLVASGGTFGNSPTFKITIKEYEDMAIKIGDRVRIEIKKVDDSGV
jgi:hypothetical protein